MAIQPTQPQSIGGVLDISFQVYKASVASVWPVCLLLVLGSVPSLYMAMQASTAASSGDPTAALAIFSNPRYWLATFFTVAMSVVASGAMYVKQDAIASGEELSLGSALQTSLSRLLPQVLMVILYALAVGIGFVLLVIPGFILMLSLMLCWILVVLERKGPIASLVGSHRLVWGNWWRTSAVLTVGFIILMVIYVAIAFVVGLVTPLLGFGGDPFMVGFVSGFIINAVLYLLVTPYYTALLLSIYWDLKLRKQGGDLAARVGALGAA